MDYVWVWGSKEKKLNCQLESVPKIQWYHSLSAVTGTQKGRIWVLGPRKIFSMNEKLQKFYCYIAIAKKNQTSILPIDMLAWIGKKEN